MGRKQQWFKKYSEASLADLKLRSLTVCEKGIYWDMIDVLRTQTDDPGYFIISGKILTIEEIKKGLRTYSAWTQGGLRAYSAWIQRILVVGLIDVVSDGPRKGAYYSPRVAKEHEEYEIKYEAGVARYYGRGDQRGHQGGDRGGDVDKNKNKKRSVVTTARPPTTHFRADPSSVPNAPTWEELGGNTQPKNPTADDAKSDSNKDPNLGRS